MIFTLTAILAVIAFSSCIFNNEEIDVKENPIPRKVYPEPCTAWGCTVDNVKKHMSQYQQLAYFDIEPHDVILPDGTRVSKWIGAYEGINPYSSGNVIDYDYCFDESSTGLKAVVIDLGQESLYQLSDIETQLMSGGYSQTGRDIKTGQTFYSNKETGSQVKLYSLRGTGQSFTHRKLKFWRLGDDELTWGEN